MAIVQYCRIPRNLSFHLLENLLPLVSQERRERILKQKSLQRAWQLWITERLVQEQFKKQFGHCCTFTQDRYGKPRVKEAPFSFNCSHAGEWVVCVYGEHEIGVDIEQIYPIDTTHYTTYFPECKTMDESNFFSLWTVKEAYLKATGWGLYKELSDLVIPSSQFDTEWVILEDKKQIHKRICRRLHDTIKGYALALCGSECDIHSMIYQEKTIELLQDTGSRS